MDLEGCGSVPQAKREWLRFQTEETVGLCSFHLVTGYVLEAWEAFHMRVTGFIRDDANRSFPKPVSFCDRSSKQ